MTSLNGLFAIFLWLSLFSFSGYNSPTHQQVTRTELVTVARTSNNVFSINKCIVGQTQHKSSSPPNKFDISITLRLYAQNVAIKFEEASGNFLTGQQSAIIFSIQNIPHRSDEDDVHFSRG